MCSGNARSERATNIAADSYGSLMYVRPSAWVNSSQIEFEASRRANETLSSLPNEWSSEILVAAEVEEARLGGVALLRIFVNPIDRIPEARARAADPPAIDESLEAGGVLD